MNNIWVDLSNALTTERGVIGVVRVQLELAAGLFRSHSGVRFFQFKEDSAIEIPLTELDWLITSNNLADAFLKYRDQKLNIAKSLHRKSKANEQLDIERRRIESLRAARKRISASLSPFAGKALRLSTAPFMEAIRASYKLRRKLSKIRSREKKADSSSLKHPFKDGDMIFSAGYAGTEKERILQSIKLTTKIYVGYFIYDTIPVGETTRHYYSDAGIQEYQAYFDWAASYCDYLIYGGITARNDAVKLQQARGLPSPLSAVIYYGSDIVRHNDQLADAQNYDELLSRIGVQKPFMLAVGSIEGRKNHETLYRAYRILLNELGEKTPQLVFAGKPDLYSTSNLIDTLKRDPNLKGKLLMVVPSDEELDALYRGSEFVLLASVYEGWSVVLAEALRYGKLCLCSDVEPLREVGGDYAYYIPVFDVMAWARAMNYFHSRGQEVQNRAQNVSLNWRGPTWAETSKELATKLDEIYLELTHSSEKHQSDIWIDISLTYLLHHQGLTGIIRSELLFAKELVKQHPAARYFACDRGHFFEVPRSHMTWLFTGENLSADLAAFNNRMNERERLEFFRSPFAFAKPAVKPARRSLIQDRAMFVEGIELLKTALSPRLAAMVSSFSEAELEKLEITEESNLKSNAVLTTQEKNFFNDHSVVFSAGVSETLGRALAKEGNRNNIFYAQVIYDLTPILTPHLHLPYVPMNYSSFFKVVSENADLILYGGKTAESDGRRIQSENSWRVPLSAPIRFGGNILETRSTFPSKDRLRLRELGVEGKYLLAVGTIENRKNHDTLYKAYLNLLNEGFEVPQMVFAGGPGWNNEDFINRLTRDSRVKNRILILTPSDSDLDLLYRRCEFTLLASLYEGWSLTLPESLEHGKFCIVADVPPLRETGGELVDYVQPWDVDGWAKRIRHYLTNVPELKAKEAKIKSLWKRYSWEDCAADTLKILLSHSVQVGKREMERSDF